MLDNEQTKYTNNVEVPDSVLLSYKSQEIEYKLPYEGLTDLVKWKITHGAGLEYVKYTNQTYQKVFVQNELRIFDYDSRIELWKWSVFGQVNRAFFSDRLNLNLGLRMDANNYSDKMNNLLNQFSPRFSASYAFGPDKFFLNFNIGRYYQLPAYTSLGFRSNNGTLVNDSLGIKYISADQMPRAGAILIMMHLIHSGLVHSTNLISGSTRDSSLKNGHSCFILIYRTC